MSMRVLKFTLFLLVASLGLFMCSGAALAAFSDVPDTHWAHKNIMEMSERGVVSGFPDGTFKPNQTVTQVEAVCMAVQTMGLDASSAGNLTQPSFPVPNWAMEDVKLALRYGLIGEDDQFSANAGATRAWVARLLVRMIGEENRALEERLLPNFTDTNEIPSWADAYVRVAQDKDLIAGYEGNKFKPNQAVSRSEMVAFLSRAGKHLPDSVTGYISGTVTEISTYQITVRADDGQSHTYSIPFTLTVYQDDRQIALTDLRRYDRVKLLADGSTLKYLEKLSGASGTTVTGTVLKVYPERNTFVITVANGSTRTLSLPDNASVSVEGSNASGLNALNTGDEVEVTLNSAGYVIDIVINSGAGGSGAEGLVYDLDLDLEPGLLTMEYANGNLASFQLANQVTVQVDGVRFANLSDVKNGDRIRITRDDNEVIAIQVLEKGARLDIAGEVIVLDEDRNIINLEVDGSLKAYRLASGVRVTVSGLSSAYLSDIKVGDVVKATGRDGQITALEVEGRQAGDSFTGTIMAVDTRNQVLTLELQNGRLEAYEVLDEARIIVDDDEESLSDLARDMDVSVRLLDGDIVYVSVDGSTGGIITEIDEDGMLLVFRKDGGDRTTYIIDDDVDVESRDDRDELDEVRRGDYARLVIENNRVTEILLRHTMICRVERVREVYDRIEVVDEDGDSLRLYVRDGVDLVVPGISYPDVDDVFRGDLVRVTYMGNDLDKVELLEPLQGEITSLDAYGSSFSLKLYNGRTEQVDFTSGSRVIAGGRTYDSISALARGDRVEVVENENGDYTFNVMDVESGELAADLDDDDESFYLEDGLRWVSYDLDEGVYIRDRLGNKISRERLADGDRVKLYMLRDMVYEIELQ